MDTEQAVVYQGIETVHTGRCCLMPSTPHFCPKHHQPLRLRISPGLRTNPTFNLKAHTQLPAPLCSSMFRTLAVLTIPPVIASTLPPPFATSTRSDSLEVLELFPVWSKIHEDSRYLKMIVFNHVQSCSIHISACSFEQCKSV